METSTKTIIRLAIGVLLLFQFHSIKAQRSEPFIKSDKEGSVRLRSLKVNVIVTGSIATTIMRMSFQNTSSRVLEAQLDFPLPEHAAVTGFALDVNNRMRPASAVEKEKGRVIFETIVRRGVDPGLLEKTKGNSFRTRIYPFNPKGSRYVEITFTKELDQVNDKAIYNLPLDFTQTLDTFMIDLKVVKEKLKPQSDGSILSGIDFESWENSWVVNKTFFNYKPYRPLSFFIPSAHELKTYVEQDVKDAGSFCFISQFKADISSNIKRNPETICLLWDVSLSMQNRQFEKEFAFLDKYLKKIKNVKLDVVTFSIDEHKTRTFLINDDTEDLKYYLKGQIYDGATRLNRINFSKHEADEYILFTDGLSNFSEEEIKLPAKPVFVISAKQVVNPTLLEFISSKSGGKWINLFTTSTDDAVNALSTVPVILKKFAGNSSLKNLQAKIATSGIVTLTGKFTGNSEVVCEFGSTGNDFSFSKTISLLTRGADDYNTAIVNKYAAAYLEDLLVKNPKDVKTITNFAKRYTLVSEYTSLIVLENISDYVLYKIEPPSELRNEYYSFVKKEKEDSVLKVQDHLKEVMNLWKERKIWAAKNFIVVPKKIEPKKSSFINNVTPPLPTQGQIRVNLIDKNTNERIPFATVVVSKDNREVSGFTTNIDGDGISGGLEPGKYIIKVIYIGYTPTEINLVEVKKQQTTTLNVLLTPSNIELQAVEVVDYLEPVVKDESGSTVTRDEYEKLPTKNINSVAATTSGVYEEGEGDEVNIRGSRGSGTDIYIDGVRITGGLPAQYGDTEATSNNNSIKINEWSSDAQYMKELEKSNTEDIYSKYIEIRKQFENTPAFFFDAANLFFKKGLNEDGFKILSNLAELDLEDASIYRVLAGKLLESKYYREAIFIYNEVIKMRGEEPQSYRDLGLAYEQNKQLQLAADMLYYVVSTPWDERFPEIELIALEELNNLIFHNKGINTTKFERSLIENISLDIRVVIKWDSDNSDMDLWVTDPMGEKCLYSNPLTETGGKISEDFTEGYGPEEFIIRKALPGNYKIEVNYYGNDSQKTLGPVTLTADIFTNYGKSNQTKQSLTFRLDENEEVVQVGEVKAF